MVMSCKDGIADPETLYKVYNFDGLLVFDAAIGLVSRLGARADGPPFSVTSKEIV